ncbi:MAG: hypothetical protein JWP63_6629 [Candidatus Solibacter sp.]|nr:hypothetical protein [Candidatus Solibacter sp.]
MLDSVGQAIVVRRLSPRASACHMRKTPPPSPLPTHASRPRMQSARANPSRDRQGAVGTRKTPPPSPLPTHAFRPRTPTKNASASQSRDRQGAPRRLPSDHRSLTVAAPIGISTRVPHA